MAVESVSQQNQQSAPGGRIDATTKAAAAAAAITAIGLATSNFDYVTTTYKACWKEMRTRNMGRRNSIRQRGKRGLDGRDEQQQPEQKLPTLASVHLEISW